MNSLLAWAAQWARGCPHSVCRGCRGQPSAPFKVSRGQPNSWHWGLQFQMAACSHPPQRIQEPSRLQVAPHQSLQACLQGDSVSPHIFQNSGFRMSLGRGIPRHHAREPCSGNQGPEAMNTLTGTFYPAGSSRSTELEILGSFFRNTAPRPAAESPLQTQARGNRVAALPLAGRPCASLTVWPWALYSIPLLSDKNACLACLQGGEMTTVKVCVP